MEAIGRRDVAGVRKHRWMIWLAGAVLVALVGLAVATAIAMHRAEPFLHAQLVAALSEHFHAHVELDGFHISLAHGLEAEGKGLRIWPPAEAAGVGVPASGSGNPLIQLDEFRFRAPLHYARGKPIQIRTVQLQGLKIDLPPRSRFEHAAGSGNAGSQTDWVGFSVGSVECTNAELVLETSKPGKLPTQLEIAHIKIDGITPSGAMKFEADFTVPRPHGKAHSSGSFGPWQVSDPGESPVSGDYRLVEADLSSFKGIAGLLSSTGHYQGTLRALQVDGETDTPDFSLTHFGNALPLHTHFHARVDGTDGDTWLDRVDATLNHSPIVAQGQVVRAISEAGGMPHPAGHDIALTIDIDRARIEDFLALVGKSTTPLLTGEVAVKAKLHIPAGSEPVYERLALDGNFHLTDARFASEKIQDRIRELSVRGQGHPGEVKSTDADTIQSEMAGNFQMEKAVVLLPDLVYSVPGALIQLQGQYGVDGSTLSFSGTAKMQATVSQMVGGWKGLLLKPADRFFKKDGAGTEVPIHIGGTRENPDFGIELGKMKITSPEKPGTNPQ
jgi:hypothetical protein